MTDFKADFKAIATALDKRGFCVVPEFLSRDEIDFLVAEFDASPDYSPPTKPGMRSGTSATSPLPVNRSSACHRNGTTRDLPRNRSAESRNSPAA